MERVAGCENGIVLHGVIRMSLVEKVRSVQSHKAGEGAG